MEDICLVLFQLSQGENLPQREGNKQESGCERWKETKAQWCYTGSSHAWSQCLHFLYESVNPHTLLPISQVIWLFITYSPLGLVVMPFIDLNLCLCIVIRTGMALAYFLKMYFFQRMMIIKRTYYCPALGFFWPWGTWEELLLVMVLRNTLMFYLDA